MTYSVGDVLIVHGDTWRIDRLYTSKDGSAAAAMVGTVKPRYGSHDRTAYTLSVLDAIATTIS